MEISLIYSNLNGNIADQRSGKIINSKIDSRNFFKITTYSPNQKKNLLIVGSVTWNLLPEKMKGCNYRNFFILSKKNTSFEECKKYIYENKEKYYKIFVIGGKQIYELFINNFLITEIFETNYYLKNDFLFNGIRFAWDKHLFTIISDNKINNENIFFADELIGNGDIEFIHYKKKCLSFELQYNNLIEKILSDGIMKQTRNGNTLSINDVSIKIDLNDGFPILTSRKVFWRGIKEELLWMLRGETDTSILRNKKVFIWDGNSNSEFLRKVGLDYEEWEIGPGYGFQFRNSGAEFNNPDSVGVDQLRYVCDKIINEPDNRRMIINLWSVKDLNKMALPPCHLLYQFSVYEGRVCCHLYQRSWDIMLGWNTSTAALLTHLIAHYTDMSVGTLTHTICDAHIYEEHLECAKLILKRTPYQLPVLEITGNKPEFVDKYNSEDIILKNYRTHDPIKMNMIA